MQAIGNDINQAKPQPDVAVTDETINYNRADDYSLFLQIGADNCTYSLLDKERNTFVSLHNFPFYHIHPLEKVYERLNLILNEGPVISEKIYSKVFVSIVNNISTIVPEAILTEGKEQNFLSLNHFVNNDDNLFSDRIRTIDAVNIYAVNKKTTDVITTRFSAAETRHFSTSLIENLIITNKNKEEKQVFLHVQPSHFEVIVIKGKSLLFYNSFFYKAPEDLIYFLLNIFEQLQLNPESIPVNLLGEIEKRSGIYNLLNKYIRFIEFSSRPDNVNFSYGFHDVPTHYYYSLFSLISCV